MKLYIKKNISTYFVKTLNIKVMILIKIKHNSPPPLTLVSILMVSSGMSFFFSKTNYPFPTTSNIDKFPRRPFGFDQEIGVMEIT